jgi:predicted PurR-regulated permease PerM
LFLLTILVIITIAFGLLIEPFFGAIVWSVVAGVLFQPLFQRVLALCGGRPNLAATITLTLIILLIIVPAILLGMALVNEAASFYLQIRDGEIDFGRAFREFEAMLPSAVQAQLAEYGMADFSEIQARFGATIQNMLQFVATQAFNVGQGAFNLMLILGVMLYLTYFLLRDGPDLLGRIGAMIPLSDDKLAVLGDKFLVVIRATIKGTFVVALLQGAIGGVIFWLLDIRGALLWSVLMAALSLIPAIGTGFVWAPVGIYLLVTGSLWEGVILLLCGFFIISMVDNVVRPILVGRDTRLPDYVVLISTLGGLQLFGFNGIVIGPLVAALFIAIWSIFAEVNRGEVVTTAEPPAVAEPDTAPAPLSTS